MTSLKKLVNIGVIILDDKLIDKVFISLFLSWKLYIYIILGKKNTSSFNKLKNLLLQEGRV